MSLALFAMIQELKAELTALTARVVLLEAKGVVLEANVQPKLTPEPKPESRPTLSLSKRA